MVAPFLSFQIGMANCTEYGLGSSVFTTDYKRAERITGALETGMTSVNDFGMVPMIQSLPFGGIRVRFTLQTQN